MKTKTFKRIYIKMLKLNIKQDEYVDKMKLNKTFSIKIQIAEDQKAILLLHYVGNVIQKLEIRGRIKHLLILRKN